MTIENIFSDNGVVIESIAGGNILVELSYTSSWSDITGKPTEFTPSAHIHAIGDVTGLQTALNGKQATLESGTNIKTVNGNSLLGSGDIAISGGGGGEPVITAGTTSQYWRGDKTFQTLDKTAVGLANVDNTSDANKPVSTAQQTALNGKANTSHSHAIAEVTGLQAVLDGKQASGSYASDSHSHVIGDTTGLQTALDGKQEYLVSGTNIKTVNGQSLLGSGDVVSGIYVQQSAPSGTHNFLWVELNGDNTIKTFWINS
jgi:hypothetical protein